MWSAATKRQEARAWGVPFLAIDLQRSGAAYRVERDATGALAIRPPLSAVKGVSHDLARAIIAERLAYGPYRSVVDLLRRIAAPTRVWEALIRSGALDTLAPRRDALYQIRAANAQASNPQQPALLDPPLEPPNLRTLELNDSFAWEQATRGFSSLELHAMDFLRYRTRELAAITLWQARHAPLKSRQRVAGLVIAKQRPPTAGGFAFYVIEDGPVRAQLIISPQIWERQRVLLRDARVLVADVVVEMGGMQPSLKVERLMGLEA